MPASSASHRPQADVARRLVAEIGSEGRRSILAQSERQRLKRGQVLFHAGQTAEYLFVVRTGHVQYSRLATNGRQVVLGILAPGDVFGLGSLVLSPMQYIGTAEAVESSELIAWSARTIRRLAVKYPQLTNNVLHIALEYVAIFTERHEQLVTSTAEQRVARALSSLGATSGTPGRNGVEVRIKNEQLAALADVSVFTASRVLNGWARKGALSKTRGAVQIVSPERLLRD